MSFMITIVFTLYYLDTRMKVVNDGVHLGTWQLNIVRSIAILLMHLPMSNNFRDATSMLEFAISNVEKFAGKRIAYPLVLCFFKLSIAILSEAGQIVLIMHYKTEYEVIMGYVTLWMITSLEDKTMSILRNSHDLKKANERPLVYYSGWSSKNSLAQAKIVYSKWRNQEINSGPFEMFFIFKTITLLWVKSFLYVTVYYYLLPFTPIVVV